MININTMIWDDATQLRSRLEDLSNRKIRSDGGGIVSNTLNVNKLVERIIEIEIKIHNLQREINPLIGRLRFYFEDYT